MSDFEKQKQEALDYFSSPAFKKFFIELSRRYYHMGDFGKSVGVQKFSEEELATIFHFMGFSEWEWTKRKSISIPSFIQSYTTSRFADIPFPIVVEEVLGSSLVYKEELLIEEKRLFSLFEKRLKQFLGGYRCYLTEEKKKSWFLVFKQEEEAFLTGLSLVKKAMDQLPKHYEKLPYFAYRLFHNPHQLDQSTLTGRLFFDCLETICQMVLEKAAFIGEAEWENIVYEQFHLLKDDSYNAVQINGLTAHSQGETVPMWTAAAQAGISWNVPLKHLLEVDEIYPFHGDNVLFVENSGVFSIICSAFPELAVVCSSGQFRYSVWKITEKMIASGARVYYSGDLDPAGLHMAQKLLQRFDNQITLLLMDEKSYKKVPKEVTISEEHLRQLNSIKSPQLLDVCELMKQEKLAGYQEGLLDELFQILEQW